MSVYGDKILQEYSGNDYDNKNFANCMEELDKIGKYYVKIDVNVADHIIFVLNEMKKCKSASQTKKMMQTCYNHANDTVKDLNKDFDKFSEAPTFSRFNSLCKKFSVKYSDITMEDKKKYTKIFKGYCEEMVSAAKQFNDSWYDEVNKELDRINRIDYEYTDKLIDHLNGWLKTFNRYYRGTHGNMIYILRKIDPGFEDTLKYKLVQKFFKSKK